MPNDSPTPHAAPVDGEVALAEAVKVAQKWIPLLEKDNQDGPMLKREFLTIAKALERLEREQDDIKLAYEGLTGIKDGAFAALEKWQHKAETAERDLAERNEDAERLKAALGLAWSLHVRQHVHLGLERWSGFEQGCIACVCALALGEARDLSPTTEEFIARRNALKEGDSARKTGTP